MSKRNLYFVKQKLMGLTLLVLTGVVGVVNNGDFTIGLLTIPIGTALVFTKNTYLVDDDFFEN